MLARFGSVVRRMKRMSMRDMRVVPCLVMIVGIVMIRRMTMMLGRMLVMLGRLAMMLCALVILHRALLDAQRASSSGDPGKFVHRIPRDRMSTTPLQERHERSGHENIARW